MHGKYAEGRPPARRIEREDVLEFMAGRGRPELFQDIADSLRDEQSLASQMLAKVRRMLGCPPGIDPQDLEGWETDVLSDVVQKQPECAADALPSRSAAALRKTAAPRPEPKPQRVRSERVGQPARAFPRDESALAVNQLGDEANESAYTDERMDLSFDH